MSRWPSNEYKYSLEGRIAHIKRTVSYETAPLRKECIEIKPKPLMAAAELSPYVQTFSMGMPMNIDGSI